MADFPVSPLVACIPVFSNLRLQAPLCFPDIHLTTLARDLVDHTCQFLLGEGSFTLVSSERRVGPDLKTALRLYFSQAFLIRSLTPLTYGITASGCFSSFWDSSSSGSLSGSSSGGVDGFCMEEEMNGKGQPFCLKVVVSSSSFRMSSFHSVMFLALLKRLLTAALLALTGWWELKCKYLSVCVHFLKTVTLRVPSSLRVRLVSRRTQSPVLRRQPGNYQKVMLTAFEAMYAES